MQTTLSSLNCYLYRLTLPLCYASLADEIRRILEFNGQFGAAEEYVASFPTEDGYRDVLDGELYRQFALDHYGSDAKWFSLTVGVDGTAIYESSHISAYPALAVINELPPNLRSVRQYRHESVSKFVLTAETL